MSGASINVVNAKNRLARDLTNNQRILYLIERNEKTLQTSLDTNGNDEDKMTFNNSESFSSQSFESSLKDSSELSDYEKSNENALEQTVEYKLKQVLASPLTG